MSDTPQHNELSELPLKENSGQEQSPETTWKFLDLLQKLRLRINATETSVSWVAGLITLAGAITWTMEQVDTRVNEIILNRALPYEALQTGKTLSSEWQYDEAIPKLEAAFKVLSKQFSEKEEASRIYSQIVDPYLFAIVNSTNPKEHENRFLQIMELAEENKFSFSGWHYHQIGWYYFRTGSIDKANIYFLKAKEEYKASREPLTLSDTFWALALEGV